MRPIARLNQIRAIKNVFSFAMPGVLLGSLATHLQASDKIIHVESSSLVPQDLFLNDPHQRLSVQSMVGDLIIPWGDTFNMSSGDLTINSLIAGTRYVRTNRATPWTQAQADAEAAGGHLVAINSQGEQQYIFERFAERLGGLHHIGATDRSFEGAFSWVNGQRLSFTNWSPGEPNNFNGVEDFTEMRPDGMWNDIGDGRISFGIVELTDRFPSSFVPRALNFTGGSIGIVGGTFAPDPGDFVLSGTGNPTIILSKATTDMGTAQLTVGRGNGNRGNYIIANGSIATTGATVIGDDGGTGFMQLDDSGTTKGTEWLARGEIIVGRNNGVGSLSIRNGAEVDAGGVTVGSNGGHGTVLVAGANTIWSTSPINIGVGGNGLVSVGTGATVVSNLVVLGQVSDENPNGHGAVVVDGDGASFFPRDFELIHGDLSVINGGHVQAREVFANDQGGGESTILIDGMDSTWTIEDGFQLGNGGRTDMNILNGGKLASATTAMGVFRGEAYVLVRGQGSTWEIDREDPPLGHRSLILGGFGTASLTIDQNGAVKIRDETIAQSNSLITIDDGQLTTGILEITGGEVDVLAGSLNIDFIASLDNGTLRRGNAGRIRLPTGGALTAENSSLVSVTGNLFIGDATRFEINSGSRLEISGGGLTVGHHFFTDEGTLVVSGNGSTVVSDSIVDVGGLADKNTTATIQGVGASLISRRETYVGGFGKSGSLSILNGADVTSDEAHVGGALSYTTQGGDGAVVVDGPGSIWDISNSLLIGANNGSGRMTVTDGGHVTVGSLSRVGRDGGSGSVLIDGDGSLWEMVHQLTLGYSGQGDLTIRNGGAVSSSHVILGQSSTLNAIGTALIDGEGSSWENSSFYINNGTLRILNGGDMTTRLSGDRIRIGADEDGQAAVHIEGAGSTWDNAGTQFIVGMHGRGELSVLDGGAVSSPQSVIGYQPTAEGMVLVDGPGSRWDILDKGPRANLFIGENGTGSLTISNQGAVHVTHATAVYADGIIFNDGGLLNTLTLHLFEDAQAGFISGDLNVGQSVNVLGATLNLGAAARLNMAANSTLGSGQGAVINFESDYTIDNGVTFHIGSNSQWTNSGNLAVGGMGDGTLTILGEVTSALAAVGEAGGNGMVTVNGGHGDGIWTNTSDLVVGNTGQGRLLIENNGSVTSGPGVIGNFPDAIGKVTVQGTVSHWNGSSFLLVGNEGLGSLSILDHGEVSNTLGIIGQTEGSVGSVVIDGVGSIWNNSDNVVVGAQGHGTLVIRNGGQVFTQRFGTIGEGGPGVGEVTVEGSGSTWDMDLDFTVGGEGDGELSILSGGAVTNRLGSIGGAGGTGSVTVSGDGSTWDNGSSLNVGNFSSGSLLVENGGVVYAVRGTLGNFSTGDGDVKVRGAGSRWSISEFLQVGNDGTGFMEISGGGEVSNAVVGIVGNNFGSNGEVLVTGGGSTWSLPANNLIVGNNGAGSLAISVGGRVSSDGGIVGNGLANSNASGGVLVDGAGSQWINASSLYVGNAGSGQVTISGGGHVSNSAGIIADEATSDGWVMVTDSGSGWENAADLFVGNRGIGALAIQNAGQVSNTRAILGNVAGSRGMASVDGMGSRWTNSLGLFVGNRGEGELSITQGGQVFNEDTVIASEAGSRGSVTVADSGSQLTSTARVIVGHRDEGNLLISQGGLVSDDMGTIAHQEDSDGAATVAGSGSTWTNSSFLIVGNRGRGTLTIEAGGQVFNEDTVIASEAGSHGSVTVTDSGSQLTSTARVIVGNRDEGNLLIEQGGLVSGDTGIIAHQEDSDGAATVAGSGSTWTNSSFLIVGNGGMGSLAVQDGGSVSNVLGLMGNVAGSTGIASVEGMDSRWTNSDNLVVGVNGNAQLTVRSGGQVVTNRFAGIGDEGSGMGNVTIDGVGSSWTTGLNLTVGRLGHGEMSILNGGTVSNGSAVIGTEAGAQGAVIVDGDGSLWTSQATLHIGIAGEGSLDILNNGRVTVAGETSIGNDGVLTIGGGTLETDTLTLAPGAEWVLNAGNLITSSITTPAGEAFNLTAGALSTGTVNGDLVQSGGVLSPGSSPGRTTIHGNYVLTDGTVFIELAGPNPGPGESGYDQLSITGGTAVLLGGSLEVALTNGFFPSIGDEFEILLADEIVGAFDTFTGDVFDIGDGLSLVPFLEEDNLDSLDVISLIAAATGDANFDGQVDAGDLNTVALKWQQPVDGGWTDGDFTGDGFVDAGDLNQVALNWQFGVPTVQLASFDDAFSQALASVPEPTTFGLMLLGGLAGLGTHRRVA